MTTIFIRRTDPEPAHDPAGQLEHHKERAKLLRSTFAELGIEVEEDGWGDTFAPESHEWVEITLALAPVVVPALAKVFQVWLDSKKIKKLEILKDGKPVSIEGATPAQIAEILGAT